jgi:hypothetical protein
MAAVCRRLEPYAAALSQEAVEAFLPQGVRLAATSKRTRLGALCQQRVWTR